MQAMNPSNAPVYMAAPAPANHMEQAVRGMPPNPLQPHSPCAANHPVGTTGFAQPRTVAASHTASICGSAVHHSPCDSICSGGFQPPGSVGQPTSLASTTPDWRFMPIAGMAMPARQQTGPIQGVVPTGQTASLWSGSGSGLQTVHQLQPPPFAFNSSQTSTHTQTSPCAQTGSCVQTGSCAQTGVHALTGAQTSAQRWHERGGRAREEECKGGEVRGGEQHEGRHEAARRCSVSTALRKRCSHVRVNTF